MSIKYVHTNLVARDWRGLAAFYSRTFACKAKPPERNLKGEWLESLTSIKGAQIRGIHLLLPGYPRNGPTLEIFQYTPAKRRGMPRTNLPGFGHIAFAVSDVGRMVRKIQRNGGRLLGKRISAAIEGMGRIDVAYARDPEGNIIEVQRWS